MTEIAKHWATVAEMAKTHTHVTIFKQDEATGAKPYALQFASTEYWIDCYDSIDDAFAAATKLGLKVIRVNQMPSFKGVKK